MLLPLAHALQGGLKIFKGLPNTRYISKALYIPRISGLHDKHYGLYDQYGRLITSAGPRRGWPNHALGQEESCCVSPSSAFPLGKEGTYIYGGHINGHFGHFITETLPRYWFIKQNYPQFKILVHSGEQLSYLFGLPWLADFFRLLGFHQNDFVRFDRPTRIHNLIIPETAFEENHFVYDSFPEFCQQLRQHESKAFPDEDHPIFLTRAYFNNSLHTITNEHELINILQMMNFKIIVPERLSLSQQIRLFSSKRPTTGFIGSAFHNSIFCPSPTGIALTCGPEYSTNYYLMDSVNHARITYLDCSKFLEESHHPDVVRRYTITEPKVLADSLAHLTNEKVWEQTEAPPRIPENFITDRCFYIKTHHGTYLQVHQQTGMIFHGDNTTGASRIQVVLSSDGWIRLFHPSALCLSINHNNDQGATLHYRNCSKRPDRITLRHYQTGWFMSAIPDGTLEGNRSQPQDWEYFQLEAILK